MRTYFSAQNSLVELSLAAERRYEDPFNDLEVWGVFTDPNGEERRVPAFWSDENNWRLRYSSPVVGRHTFLTQCSEPGDGGLHLQRGEIEISPYAGTNALLRHGPIRVSSDGCHLEHLDGTPFFWLGDTWWLGFVKRFKWPEDFKILTSDRTEKGFTMIQLVAGLYPEMEAFDEQGAGEAG